MPDLTVMLPQLLQAGASPILGGKLVFLTALGDGAEDDTAGVAMLASTTAGAISF